ncbi:MAG: alpha-hydroxy-acid oxidizing protein [Silvibacterium sp.]|nr:alpha-hydroxy-acid oxidizing protein [Silvibacterium sp.]
MAETNGPVADRRRFIQFLATSALAMPFGRAMAQQLPTDALTVIAAAKDGLQVVDFEGAARRILPPAHWGYLASGVDDDETLKANVEGFRHIGLKPRRLVDVSKPNLETEVFGARWETPLFLCPVGSQRAFHPEGELATARAVKARRHTMMLSNASTYSIEEVTAALGIPPWQQLYMPVKWSDTERLVKRIEDTGCPVLVWTIDLQGGRNTPTLARFERLDNSTCRSCHQGGNDEPIHMPMYGGLGDDTDPTDMTWKTLDRLKKLTKMKVVLKGIDSAEDARLAVRHGVDGLVVSNHGGRSIETLRATIDCLPEVIAAVKGRVPVFLDGGVRHGADIYKAIALGARGVGIGRPYVWGLSAFGEEGVACVLDILDAELRMTMQQMGTPTVKEISATRLTRV